MTQLELRNRIRKKLGETTALFWTDTELNDWMNDAQRDIVWRAKLKRTRGTFTTISSTARYTLSTVFASFMRICDGGVWIYNSDDTSWNRCEYKSKTEMDLLYPNWPENTDTGLPFIYMEDIDENVLELYPVPQTSCVGTNYCRVYYSALPTDMSADGDSADLDHQELLHPAIIDWVVATGFESRGYWDIANDCWSKYYDKIKAYLIEKNNKEDEEITMKSYRNI